MTSSATPQLNKTVLNSIHRRLGARMVDSGGWDMPPEYSGILAENIAARPAKILKTKAAVWNHFFFFAIFIFGYFRLTAATTEACSGFPELLPKASRA